MPPYYRDETKNKNKWIKSVEVLKDNIKGLEDELNKTFHQTRKKHSGSWGIYFRGQDDIKNKLIPSAGRKQWYAGKYLLSLDASQERNLLHRFLRASYNRFGKIPSLWETLLLARHYGLPTRLLDWTRNAYIGLYFACVSDKKPRSDVALWVFVRFDDEEYDINALASEFVLNQYKYAKDFKFNVDGVKIIYPPCVTERIRAQSSIFTYQANPILALEKYDRNLYCRKDFDILLIRKWKVPCKNKEKLLEALNPYGISAGFLFPDFEGFARGLLQTEIMRSGKKTPTKKGKK